MMKESSSTTTGYRKPKNKKNGFQINMWFGIDFLAWIRILARNKFRIHKSRLPVAIAITLVSLINTLLRWLELLVYGRRISSTQITKPPVFIIGYWRSGTTLLHELMGLDQHYTYPTTYECFVPNHFLLTEQVLGSLSDLLLPERRPMDNMAVGFDRPAEDEWALCSLGLPSFYLNTVFPNEPLKHLDYLDLDDLAPQKRQRWEQEFVRFLKRITCRRARPIILKSPPHTFRIRALLKLFPGARFIYIMRDPYITFSSAVHMFASYLQTYSMQQPRSPGLEEFVFDLGVRLHDTFEKTKELIPAGHLYEMRYEDLVKDTIGELRRVYQALELGDFEAQLLTALQDYLAEVSLYRTNQYELTPQQRSEISRRWSALIARYNHAAALATTQRPNNGQSVASQSTTGI